MIIRFKSLLKPEREKIHNKLQELAAARRRLEKEIEYHRLEVLFLEKQLNKAEEAYFNYQDKFDWD